MEKFKRVLSYLVFFTSFAMMGQSLYANDPAQSVNINTASVEELADGLTGVGKQRAQAIVDYREQHGPFTSVDDLLAVDGIGVVTLDRNREVLIVE